MKKFKIEYGDIKIDIDFESELDRKNIMEWVKEIIELYELKNG